MIATIIRTTFVFMFVLFAVVVALKSLPVAMQPSLAIMLLSSAVLVLLSSWVWSKWAERRFANRVARIGVARSGYGAFNSRWAPSFWIRRSAKRLSDDALLGAWHLPEHTALAKSIIQEELVSRGFTIEQIKGWLRPEAMTHAMPAFTSSISLPRYQSIVATRIFLFNVFRWMALLILVLFGLWAAHGDHRETEAQAERRRIAAEKQEAARAKSAERKGAPAPAAPQPAAPAKSERPKDTRPIETISPDSQFNPNNLPPERKWIGHGLAIAIGPLYWILSLGALAVVLAATWLGRRRALRILLLRPFGRARMTRPVKRLVLGKLGHRGLVFTLEDRNYRRNEAFAYFDRFGQWVSYVIAPWLRQPFRIATVNNERSYLDLALALRGRWGPSFNSFMNGGQAFNVRCTNPWWQTVIDLLINSSDVIVMDVSRVSSGSAWEIDRMEAREVVGKCLFVVQRGYEQDAAVSVAKLLPDALVPKIFVYESNGRLVENAEFESALTERMEKALAAWSSTTSPGASLAPRPA